MLTVSLMSGEEEGTNGLSDSPTSLLAQLPGEERSRMGLGQKKKSHPVSSWVPLHGFSGGNLCLLLGAYRANHFLHTLSSPRV